MSRFFMTASGQEENQAGRQRKGQESAAHAEGPFANRARNNYTGQYVINTKLTSPVLKVKMSDNPVNTNSPGRPKDMAKRQA
ncbi:MAG: hypothetical protein ACRESD_19670, partial [Pseudomonas sp.]